MSNILLNIQVQRNTTQSKKANCKSYVKNTTNSKLFPSSDPFKTWKFKETTAESKMVNELSLSMKQSQNYSHYVISFIKTCFTFHSNKSHLLKMILCNVIYLHNKLHSLTSISMVS